VTDEIFGDLHARHRLGIADAFLGPRRLGFVVGRAFQNDWKCAIDCNAVPRRAVNVRREADAVACRNHDVMLNRNIADILLFTG